MVDDLLIYSSDETINFYGQLSLTINPKTLEVTTIALGKRETSKPEIRYFTFKVRSLLKALGNINGDR